MRSIRLLRSLFYGLVLIGLGGGAYSGLAQAPNLLPLIGVDQTWSYDDSGDNLGTEWKEVGYDDGAWETGQGALGFPAGETLPFGSVVTLLEQGSSPQTITFYFRTHFQFSGTLDGVTLTLSNYVDDGAIFYLNGTEVGRIAMPEGEVTSSTLASRASDIGNSRIEVLEVPTSLLVQGDNVLAVEVHQGSTGSSDAILGSVLTAAVPGEGAPVIVRQPQDVTAPLGDNATMDVVITGALSTFQWFKDGALIPGATNSVLQLVGVTADDQGVYSVFIENDEGSVNSATAVFNVDEGPITLVNFGSTWNYDESGGSEPVDWETPEFDDSGWLSGPGILGFPIDEGLPDFQGAELSVQTLVTRTQGRFAYYFRTTFEFNENALDYELDLTTLFDDGSVLYINGEEVLRIGMEEGNVGYSTSANRSVGDAGLETFTLPASVLQPGENTLAIEMHQTSATSSDMIMAVRLVAQPLEPTEIQVLAQPVDAEVEEAKDAVFEVENIGDTARFFWYRVDDTGTNLIAGADRPRYIFEDVELEDDGSQYFVVMSNIVNVVTSDLVTLTVIPDVVAPTILVADGTPNSTTIIVTYDEEVDSTSARTGSNYEIADTEGGPNLAITSLVLEDGTNVVLTTSARLPNRNYILTVNNVEDVVGNEIAEDSKRPVRTLVEMVRVDNNWEFWNPDRAFDEYPLVGTEWYTDPEYDLADQPGSDDYYYWFWRESNAAFIGDTGNQDIPARRNTSLSQTWFLTSNYRTTFSFNGSEAGAVIKLRHLIDDGAVFYINGEEAYRYNLPGGEITTNTPAITAVGAASFRTVELPFSALSQGDNFIAVQVHQRAIRDVDNVFAMQLTAEVESFNTGPVVITSDPEDQEVEEGADVLFTFTGVAGTSFQWLRNGADIPGATGATYTLENASLTSDSGAQFSVRVMNDEGSETSGSATLTVRPDMIPPTVVSAFGFGSTIAIQFSEDILPSSGNDVSNYSLAGPLGGPVAIISASTVEDVVTLTLGSPALVGSIVTIADVIDNSNASNPMEEAVSFSVGFGGNLVTYDSEWRYDASGDELGTEWRELDYDDSSWSSGPGLLGEETASIPFPLFTSTPAPGSGGPTTTYFRYEFDLAAVSTLPATLSHVIDDGVVFYLNGQEIYRVGVANGQDSTTLASRTVGDATLEGPFPVAITSLLQPGRNVLAAEVHQASTGSSDIVFGAEMGMEEVLSIQVPPPPPPPVLPTLTIEVVNAANVRISWDQPADRFVLERSRGLGQPFFPYPAALTDSPNTSYVARKQGPWLYFRLRQVE